MISATITGNLAADAEVRTLGGGTTVLSFRIGSNSKRKVNGEWTQKTEWVGCSLFGERATKIADFLTKGKCVAVRGELETRTWEKDGQPRFALEMRVDNVELLSRGGDSGSKKQQEEDTQPETDDPDQIPF